MMKQWHTLEPEWKPEKAFVKTPLIVNAVGPVFPEHKEVLLAFKQHLEEIGWVPPKSLKELEIPGLRESHLGYWIRQATSNDLLDAGFREWEAKSRAAKRPDEFPDCAGRPPRFYDHPTAHYQIYNDLNDGPYKLHRDPSTNWGITVHMAAKAQTWSCCGMDIEHPGCWMGEKMHSYVLYDLAPAFKKEAVWQKVYEEDFEGIRRLWRVPPQIGTKWLRFKEYDRIDREIRQGKIEVENDIIEALRVTHKEPEKLTHLLKLQTILNSPQCVKYPPEDYLGFSEFLNPKNPPQIEPIVPHDGENEIDLSYSDDEEILEDEIEEQTNSEIKAMEQKIKEIAQSYKALSKNRGLFRVRAPPELKQVPGAGQFYKDFQNELKKAKPSLEQLRIHYGTILEQFEQFRFVPVLKDNMLEDVYEHDKLLYAQLKLSTVSLEREQINSKLIKLKHLSKDMLQVTDENAIRTNLKSNFIQRYGVDPTSDTIARLYLGQTEKFDTDLAISRELDKRKQFSRLPTTNLELLRTFPTDADLDAVKKDLLPEQIQSLREATSKQDFDAMLSNYLKTRADYFQSELAAFLSQFEKQAEIYNVEKLNDFVDKLNNTDIKTEEDLRAIRREWDNLVGNVRKDFERLPDGVKFSEYLTDEQLKTLIENAGFTILDPRNGPRELTQKVEKAKKLIEEQNKIFALNLAEIQSILKEDDKNTALKILEDARSLLKEIDVYDLPQKRLAIEKKLTELAKFIKGAKFVPPPLFEPDRMPQIPALENKDRASLILFVKNYSNLLKSEKLRNVFVGYARLLLLDSTLTVEIEHEPAFTKCWERFIELLRMAHEEKRTEEEFTEILADPPNGSAVWQFRQDCGNLPNEQNLIKLIQGEAKLRRHFAISNTIYANTISEQNINKLLKMYLDEIRKLPLDSDYEKYFPIEIPDPIFSKEKENLENSAISVINSEEFDKIVEQRNVLVEKMKEWSKQESIIRMPWSVSFDNFKSERTEKQRNRVFEIFAKLQEKSTDVELRDKLLNQFAESVFPFTLFMDDETLFDRLSEIERPDVREKAAKMVLTEEDFEGYKKYDVYDPNREGPPDVEDFFATDIPKNCQEILDDIQKQCTGQRFPQVREILQENRRRLENCIEERMPRIPQGFTDIASLQFRNADMQQVIRNQLEALANANFDCKQAFYESFYEAGELYLTVSEVLGYWLGKKANNVVSEKIFYVLSFCGRDLLILRKNIMDLANNRKYSKAANQLLNTANATNNIVALQKIEQKMQNILTQQEYEENFIFDEVSSDSIDKIRIRAQTENDNRSLISNIENARLAEYWRRADEIRTSTKSVKLQKICLEFLQNALISVEQARQKYFEILKLNSRPILGRISKLKQTHKRFGSLLQDLEILALQDNPDWEDLEQQVSNYEENIDSDAEYKNLKQAIALLNLSFASPLDIVFFNGDRKSSDYDRILRLIDDLQTINENMLELHGKFIEEIMHLKKFFKMPRTQQKFQDFEVNNLALKNFSFLNVESFEDFDNRKQQRVKIANNIRIGLEKFQNYVPDDKLRDIAENCSREENFGVAMGLVTVEQVQDFFILGDTNQKFNRILSKYEPRDAKCKELLEKFKIEAEGKCFDEVQEVIQAPGNRYNPILASVVESWKSFIKYCNKQPSNPQRIADMLRDNNEIVNDAIQMEIESLPENLRNDIEEILSIFE